MTTLSNFSILPSIFLLLPGILMDACIRSFNDEKEVLAISCVSYLQSTLLDTSKISNVDVDAYIFLLNSQGNIFFCLVLFIPGKPM